MKNNSFYQFILKEINKSSMTKMNLPNFTRLIRKKAQDVPTSQLFYLYKELQRIKSFNSQFHSNNNGNYFNERVKALDTKPVMKFQSYEKHTLICLQQIAIKIKQKNGFEEGVDLCKLFYLRLLNVIQYNLPYVNVLDQFREEFLWKDIGQQVIDYVSLIEKNPVPFGSTFVDTVNTIIQTVSEQLQNIDILQLPYLKQILSKGQIYGIYDIQDQMLQRLDSIINDNKYAYSFRELQSCLSSDRKNKETQQFYALMSKDITKKRLNYLYIDSKNDQFNHNRHQLNNIKKQIGFPGKSISEENVDSALRTMSELAMYGVYMNIFKNLSQQNQNNSTSFINQCIKYHFNYFFKSGNINCELKEIVDYFSSIFCDQQQMKPNGIKFKKIQILKFFFVTQMLSRQRISGKQLFLSHLCLQDELQSLNLIPKPKLEHINKIFDGSIKYYSTNSLTKEIQPLLISYSYFVNSSDDKLIINLLSQQLQIFDLNQKNFIMNELIICLINGLKQTSITQYTLSLAKLLQIFMKISFKKFSTQSSNIQKILQLFKQKQNQINRTQLEQIDQKTKILIQSQTQVNEIFDEKNFKDKQQNKSWTF